MNAISRRRFLLRLALACTASLAPGVAFCAPLILTSETVEAGANDLYRTRLAEAQQKFELDNDAAFSARIERIATRVIARATLDYPASASVAWEIHTTDNAEEGASSMAGGKLLVGRPYVHKLGLSDAELAMLISHEVAHVVLNHNVKEMQAALTIEPERLSQPFLSLQYAIDHDATLMAKLAALNSTQESEADLEGLRIAAHAGWPPLELAGYFKKMARADPMANFDSRDHPATARRWRAARELAKQLSRDNSAR